MLYVRIVFVADHRLGGSGGVRWSREESQVVLWAILSPASKYVLVSNLDNYNNRCVVVFGGSVRKTRNNYYQCVLY